ncbi:MAG: hypothetical protein IKN73_02795 [Alphaproteobacteria bacterium]|nr:hypothetical protein [Alphaproteobacteria bacterium]
MKIFLIYVFILLPSSVVAEPLFNTDIINGCGNSSYYKAILETNTYNCSNGYYLPAGGISCETCPINHTCNGGFFVYNPTITQGLEDGNILVQNVTGGCLNNFGQNFSAVFILNSYNCSPGYYLPANFDECRPCLLNHYCVGGTYSFNETTDQGIEECPSMRPFAPVNSDICYAHILHVGNDIIYLRSNKLTTPSLNVAYGNEVFYTNMTTTPTYMTSGSSHYFKTIYNNTEYYICDDTTYNVED